MNEKQQQLTFDKGITNVPSDALCSDNTLQECVGMVYDNGEHRPIQKPSVKATDCEGVVMFIHNPNSSTENYIYVEADNDLAWGQRNTDGKIELMGTLESGINKDETQITAIGKTLIVNKPSGLTYYSWKGEGYSQLASAIPDIDIDFRLIIPDGGGLHTEETGDVSEFFNGPYRDVVVQQEAWNDTVIGTYHECKNYIAKEKKGFVGPFFIRAAVKMYDGSYVKLTPPILIVPSVQDNHSGYFYNGDGHFKMTMFYRALQYKINTDYSDYRDLVTSVVVFVSDQVETHNTTQSEYGSPYSMTRVTEANNVEHVCIRKADNGGYSARYSDIVQCGDNSQESSQDWIYRAWGFRVLNRRSENDINKDLQEISIFYKLFETEDIFTNLTIWNDASSDIRDGVMGNIRTQEQLPDEYYGHTERSGSYAYVYNSRLNLANVQRTFFKGFRKLMPYDWYLNNTDTNAITKYYEIYVDIETDGGDITVKDSFTSSERFGLWFYYPDPRAKRVRIFQRAIDGGPLMLFLDENLKEHTGLNGAYYFDGLPFESEFNKLLELADIPTESTELTETLNNTIITSEVNNPYIFNASGYNQAGDGTIFAVIANTKALSQGQFGQYPLMIFTDKGIWAMELNNTGLFVSSTPASREVCNNAASIVQTDGAIFFSSEKGLMVMVGSDVKCVSEQMGGDFKDFLKHAKIAYDYRDSLLWIMGPADSYAYIYAIKNGTFHKTDLLTVAGPLEDDVPVNVVNKYPDMLIQVDDTIYSLLEKPLEHDDDNTYHGTIVTRPIKLENGLALKSIMQIRHVLQFSPYTVTETHEEEEVEVTQRGTMTLRIFASNNLDPDPDTWVELHSLRGTPWKYYKFRYDFADMKATDRFAGTMLITQERRSNKLR